MDCDKVQKLIIVVTAILAAVTSLASSCERKSAK
jgi:hypothetical protein